MTEILDETMVREAEAVLKHYEERTQLLHQTHHYAFNAGKTAGDLARHLTEARKISNEEDISYKDRAQYAWHISWIETLTARYWRQTDQHA